MSSDFGAPSGAASPIPPPPPGSSGEPPSPPGAVPPPAPSAMPSPTEAEPAAEPTKAAEPPPGPERHDLSDILAMLEDEPDDVSIAAVAERPPVHRAPEVGAALTDPRDLERPSRESDVVIVPDGGLDFDPTFASFGQRVIGLFVDGFIVNLTLIPALVGLTTGSAGLIVLGGLASLVAFVALTIIAARSIAAKRQFIGNRVAGTYIVDQINGSNLDTGRAAARFVVRHLVSSILLLGFLVAFADTQRRTFHDRVAGSVVIQRQREVWTAD